VGIILIGGIYPPTTGEIIEFVLAIVGGTGIYAGASGIVRAVQNAPGTQWTYIVLWKNE